jgi:predicted O-linked N-acetylglucosamine transferase (SPINDLY family)
MLQVTMVGATFRPAQAKDIVRALGIGDRVQLRADPDNEYDTTAVAVYSDDVHIGFVPKESNSALFAVLMDGAEISAEIVAFENSLKPVLEINFDSMPADSYGQDD